MSGLRVSGHFIEGAKGPIFVLLRQPLEAARGCLLVVPPFAEEMNKSRRMVTEVALRLAEQGIATLIPDLYGTGDSQGDFADADWATWQADLAAASKWSAGKGCTVTGILAVRLGCSLVAAATLTGAVPPVGRTVLWQPVFDGSRFLKQFLRLRTAASLMAERKETSADLYARLQGGVVVEVAGYRLSSRLAADLEDVRSPQHLPESLGEIAWFEVVREPGAPLPPPSERLLDQTRRNGLSVHVSGVAGEPYWSSSEVVVNHDIVVASVDFIGSTMQRPEGYTGA